MAVLDDAGVTTPIILVGHSLGTMVVLNFFTTLPAVSAAVSGVWCWCRHRRNRLLRKV